MLLLQGHTGRVSCLALSPSGRLLASGQLTYLGFTADIIIWDLETRSLLHRLQLQKVRLLCWRPALRTCWEPLQAAAIFLTAASQQHVDLQQWRVVQRSHPATYYCVHAWGCCRSRFKHSPSHQMSSGWRHWAGRMTTRWCAETCLTHSMPAGLLALPSAAPLAACQAALCYTPLVCRCCGTWQLAKPSAAAPRTLISCCAAASSATSQTS